MQAAVNTAPCFAHKKNITTIKHIQQHFKQKALKEEQNKYDRLQKQVRTKGLQTELMQIWGTVVRSYTQGLHRTALVDYLSAHLPFNLLYPKSS